MERCRVCRAGLTVSCEHFYARIVREGTTSVTVNVEVFAQRMGLNEVIVKVTEATLTFVATGEDRAPRKLPATGVAQPA
ncbi:hypothetical protein SAMN05192542_101492 [Paraburkholderia caballeronis]|uniref:Acyl-CoA thioesterase YciA n=1 Tax=Paraburkholderia caballeronis TaxID=416943 RepID=A0A1H7G2R4_9BURK|nr:hypothetical protein C7403_106143 [Paraburkholderia caballeronis]PXX00552.1 hypothetical protein C7407_106143 [Paraburkholderia caballeronis]RAJ98615.1 hypothetical protein C7409_106143 [Paraburkholderia caballeronis]SEK29975.1 hypothetical protein SAMN05192542_101492 [Paraburkholderia caballeronis]